MDKHVQKMMETRGIESSPMMPQMFGNAGREHMEKYGTCVLLCGGCRNNPDDTLKMY